MSANTAIFTIVSANYIAFAATLMQSVRRFHPDVPRFIILSDARHSFDDLDIAAELIACDELGIHLIGNMKLWYSVIEFNTAVKPFTFRHLFNDRGFASAIYLDPDIQLYAPLDQVFTALADHSLVLTPHMTKPLQDGKHPSDLSIMTAGVYNLGFAAIANDEDGRGLIDWWCDRLFTHCRVDVPGNLFTDQRWMDLSPAFVERTFLLRHPGYNIAYWNLVHRTVEQSGDGTWLVNGLPLVFFHFSGIKPEDPSVFSKHQDRFTVATLGKVALLCDDYRQQVLSNGWLRYNRIPYAYAVFGDGCTILESMRHWLLRAIDDGTLSAHARLRIGSAYFDVADDERFAGNGQLTRFALQFWRDRRDLRDAFNIHRPDGFAGYVEWLCGGSGEREDVPAANVQAQRALRDGAVQPSLPASPASPPWQALSTEAWDGPASRVNEWLSGEIRFDRGGASVRLQRQAALLWERRTDLQHFFPLRTVDDVEQYHVWTLTDGMQEGSIVPDLFSAHYLAWLDAPSPIARLYPETPVTNGMALTRRCGHARAGLQNWSQFPLDAAARLEQAFWYAYLAPKAFGWPEAMTASVRAFMDGPSGTSVGAYEFSRGMVAPYHMRDDVQHSYDLDTERGRWRYLCWLLAQGTGEYGLDPVALCPGLRAFLASPSGQYPLLDRLAAFAYEQRDDLQAAFNLSSRADLFGMQNWVRTELPAWLEGLGLASLLPLHSAGTGPALAAIRVTAALTGDWDTPSGVGEDLRSSAASLDACNFRDYVIVNLNSGQVLHPDGTVLPAGTPVEADWNIVHHNADTAAADWLALRRIGVTARRTVGHWHWELERLPSYWQNSYSYYDEIWASSRFAAEAFAADARRPVRMLNGAVTVPEGVRPLPRRQLGLREDATVFLFMFDFGSYVSRKNPQAVIDAFAQAFPLGTEPVQLLIKTQNAALRPELWSELTGRTDDERLLFRDERLSRAELVGLIASANAFVSLHRSEGYGRVPAEAMLLGVPVILTGYSGTADFTDADCACIVAYDLVMVDPADYPGVEQQRWADPNVENAARHMQWVHTEPEAARAMAVKGQWRVRDMLNPVRTGTEFIRLLTSCDAPGQLLT